MPKRQATIDQGAVQRPPAEVLYRDELRRLQAADTLAKPPGWKLSPRAVRAFILGGPTRDIRKKFVGHASAVDRAMVALATNRGLMLIGEPGKANWRATPCSLPNQVSISSPPPTPGILVSAR